MFVIWLAKERDLVTLLPCAKSDEWLMQYILLVSNMPIYRNYMKFSSQMDVAWLSYKPKIPKCKVIFSNSLHSLCTWF